MTAAEEALADALEALRESGAPYVLRRNPQHYNAAESSAGGAPAQTWNGFAADWTYKRELDGSLVQTEGIRLLVASEEAIDPKPGDVAEYAGARMRVEEVNPIRIAGVAVAFDVMHARA